MSIWSFSFAGHAGELPVETNVFDKQPRVSCTLPRFWWSLGWWFARRWMQGDALWNEFPYLLFSLGVQPSRGCHEAIFIVRSAFSVAELSVTSFTCFAVNTHMVSFLFHSFKNNFSGIRFPSRGLVFLVNFLAFWLHPYRSHLHLQPSVPRSSINFLSFYCHSTLIPYCVLLPWPLPHMKR